PVPNGDTEGITFFDHPANPGHPTKWHVREDGWMGASTCMDGPVLTTRKLPLMLRYLLHAHKGKIDAERAEKVLKEFGETKPYVATKATVKHTQFVIERG
ncbi:MAG: PmoA family protein, partial [Planctomycetes bacterium]|nr:PmoA family protein [Planctomycetota bacterium]